MTRRSIFAGHSHVRVFETGRWAGAAPVLSPLTGHEDKNLFAHLGASPRDEAYWDALVESAKDSDVFLFWNGNQHLSEFLFAPTPPFDFVLASAPALPIVSGTTVLPEALVREQLNRGNRELGSVLSRLRAQPGCRPVVCGTPPPKGNEAKLWELIPRDISFTSKAERLRVDIKDIPLTPASVRRKLWVATQELLQEIATEAGCEFIPSPLESQDETGYLKLEYWKNDATHANFAYGSLFLPQLVGELDPA